MPFHSSVYEKQTKLAEQSTKSTHARTYTYRPHIYPPYTHTPLYISPPSTPSHTKRTSPTATSRTDNSAAQDPVPSVKQQYHHNPQGPTRRRSQARQQQQRAAPLEVQKGAEEASICKSSPPPHTQPPCSYGQRIFNLTQHNVPPHKDLAAAAASGPPR